MTPPATSPTPPARSPGFGAEPPDPEPEPISRKGSARPQADPAPADDPAAVEHRALPGLVIDLHLDAPDVDPPAAGWLESRLQHAARLAGVTAGHLSLTFFDDRDMARLHDDYCGDPTPTDVITFDLRDDPAAPGIVDGDLALGRDAAVRAAATSGAGRDPRDELLLYALHGLLHLLGENDATDDAYTRMHRREDELLQAIGVGAVFRHDPAAPVATTQARGDA